MIVLNLLNQLFGRRDSISRADIDAYQKGKSQKQRIEENAAADEFDDNALEGWAESGLQTDAMRKLDKRISKKFGGSSYSSLVGVLLAVLILGSGILLYISYQPTEKILSEETSEIITLNQDTERTEVDLIPEIEALIEISENDQVRPQELIAKNIAQTKKVDANDESEQKNNDLVPALPSLPIISNTTDDQTTASIIYQQAKEIYLKDLKLIDYREYRDGEVATERLRYSGIPANQENWEQSSNDELIWEKVNVPYIEYIDKTMDLVAKKKYKKALSRLELILKNYPDDINANFYSGFSYFNLGSYDLAIERFEKSYTIQFGNFYEEARWFKSLALENSNKHTEARKLWKEIVAEKGFYAKEAEKKMKY
jgi:TolA-binding protein